MKTVINRLQPSEAPASQASGPELVPKDLNLVGHIPVTMSAVVGSVSISVERLFALKKGEVLEMNETLDAPLTLMLNGKPVARGELVAVGDNFGIRITELA